MFYGASLVTQVVKNPPAMQETWVDILCMQCIFMHIKILVINALKMFQYSVNSAKQCEKISRLLLFICSSSMLSLNSLWRKTLTITYKALLQEKPCLFFSGLSCFDTIIFLRRYVNLTSRSRICPKFATFNIIL